MLKSYVFDLDQNILHTKTPIYLLAKQLDGSRKEEAIPNAEFEKKLEDKEHYKFHDDIEHSMREFRGTGKLIRDIKEAIHDKAFGPSRHEFKRSTIDAAPTHIITARGNPMEEFKKMHKFIIYELLTETERQELAYNMANNSQYHPHQIDKLITQYLNSNIYIPCSNPELIQKLKRSGVGSAEKKALAFEKCIKKNISTFSRYYGAPFMKHRHMSIGFSDDSKKNVDAIRKSINEKLLEKYPQILFYLYNTEDPLEIKKEIIQRKPHSKQLF